MHSPVDVQLWRLALLCLMGIFCNILFHIYTAFRAASSPSKLTGHIMDGLVAVLVLVSIAAAVFLANYGEIRLYIALAIVMGFIISEVLVGSIIYTLVYRCTRFVINGIVRAKHSLRSAYNSLLQKAHTLIGSIFEKNPPNNGNGA